MKNESGRDQVSLMYSAIVRFMFENGYPPTMGDIATMMGEHTESGKPPSKSTVANQKNLAVDRGLIRVEGDLARAITVPGVYYAIPNNVWTGDVDPMTKFFVSPSEYLVDPHYLGCTGSPNLLWEWITRLREKYPSIYVSAIDYSETIDTDIPEGVERISYYDVKDIAIYRCATKGKPIGLISDNPWFCPLWSVLGWPVYDPMTVIKLAGLGDEK